MTSPLITLRDQSSGAEASILTTLGFNCFRFEANAGGKRVSALWAAPGFDKTGGAPSGSGIPLLFPFPGRIAGTTLEWEGKSYPLETLDNFGNGIHGFVYTRPWRVTEQTESRAVGEFQASVDAPELLKKWPADFRLIAEYDVRGNALIGRYTLSNPDERPLPCGFGAHPYFRVPLAGSDASQTVARLPVTQRWELKQMLTTGQKATVAEAATYQAGLPFEKAKFDDVFTGLVWTGDRCVSEIIDQGSGLKTVVEFDRLFRDCVVYTPGHREAICVEPYTCPPDPFRLAQQGVADHGLIVLGPGESRQGLMEIRVENA